MKPPLDDWRRLREALAALMWRPDFQTMDGAFTRIAELERWRQADAEPGDMTDEARLAAGQAEKATGLLLRHAFSRREYRAASRRWRTGHRNPRRRPTARK